MDTGTHITVDYFESDFIQKQLDSIATRMAALHNKHIRVQSTLDKLMKHKEAKTIPKSMMGKIPIKTENHEIISELNNSLDVIRVKMLNNEINARAQSLDQIKKEQELILSTAKTRHSIIINNRRSAHRPFNAELFLSLFSSAINSRTDELYGIIENNNMDKEESKEKKAVTATDKDEMMHVDVNEETILLMIEKSVNTAINKHMKNNGSNSNKNNSKKNNNNNKNNKKDSTKKTQNNSASSSKKKNTSSSKKKNAPTNKNKKNRSKKKKTSFKKTSSHPSNSNKSSSKSSNKSSK